MTSRTLRLAFALAAFLAVSIIGMQVAGISLDGVIPTPTGDPPLPGAARDPFELTARALWLMPVAVVLDIAFGAAAANGLALPLPMEATGTLLVALLCGPAAGALTGAVSLLLWGTVVPAPYQLPAAPAFAVIGVLVGLLAGAIVGTGLLRPRPHAGLRAMLVALGVMVAAIAALVGHGWFLLTPITEPPLPSIGGADGLMLVLGWVVAFVLVASAIAGLARLLFLRDVTVVAVAVAGLLIGAASAAARTPIAAGILDGRTGFGFDPWVAAVTAANGDPWISTLRTLLLFEPLDRMLVGVGAYVAIVTLLGVTTRARYPRGEWLIADGDDFALRVGSSLRASRW